MKKINKLSILLLSTVMLTGCTDLMKKMGMGDEEAGASTAGIESGNAGISGMEMQSIDNQMANMGPEFRDPNNPLSQATIYFMYNSAQIQQQYIAVITAHAQYLLAHPGHRMLLEGHADERGSPEYNIALGEQRAKAVSRIMKTQGVADAQLEVISIGEEKPSALEHNESAWRLNRRVALSYQEN